MSADNYMLVDVKDGIFRVWNASASVEDHPEHYGCKPLFQTLDPLEAVNAAYKECEDGYVEYGVSITEEVRNEMAVAKLRKDAAYLTGFGWKKSDTSETSTERDGWSFVASHAEEIVRFLTTNGE